MPKRFVKYIRVGQKAMFSMFDLLAGLRYRMEGDRQEKQGHGSGEEDLRRLQKPDGRTAHIP